MDIKKRADHLARFFRSRDPFEIVRGLNVILVYYPLDGVRGFYQYFQRNNIIYIDEKLPKHEQAFVLAHELGHMFLHKRSNAIFMDTRTQFNMSKYETEANLFAMHLLISDENIEEYQEFTIEQISRIFGYSQELMQLKMLHRKEGTDK